VSPSATRTTLPVMVCAKLVATKTINPHANNLLSMIPMVAILFETNDPNCVFSVAGEQLGARPDKA
jgi:hypothetical protein